MKQEFITKSAGQTQKLASKILKEVLIVKNRKTAAVLALEGELGGGKTTFTQGLAKVLGVKEKITSPTFVIMKKFDIRKLGNWDIKKLYHIDCYRLDDAKDLAELGFAEILEDPKNLIVIEWADKVKSLIPQAAVWVGFEWVDENKRRIIFYTV